MTIDDDSREGLDILSQTILLSLTAGQEIAFHNNGGAYTGGTFNIGFLHTV